MSGARITIEVDDAALRRELADLMRRIERPGDALEEIGELLTASTQQRFSPSQQRAPDGTPWADNTETTKARKRNPNILTEGGNLGDLIRYQLMPGGQGVEVGSDRVYAAVHQFGNPLNRMFNTPRGITRPNGRVMRTSSSSVRATSRKVSIRTRPNGRVMPSPMAKKKPPASCFNPHPAEWPGDARRDAVL